jgi:hypothetical protein
VKAPDVADNAVNGADVVNNSLTGNDVNALTGGDVTNDSLTGLDVKESTLQGVNAAKVDGADVCNGVVELSDTTPPPNPVRQQICAGGSLMLEASCVALFNQTLATVILYVGNTVSQSFYVDSNGQNDSDWPENPPGELDNKEVLVASATDSVGTVELNTFAAGASDGQLVGQVAARARFLSSNNGTCRFAFGITN